MTETINETKKIWWLASYPKSGNTWLRLFLSAYGTGRLNINQPTHSTGDLNSYWYTTTSPKQLKELTPYEMVVVRQAALLHLVTVSPLKPLAVKTHNVNGMIDEMRFIPPGMTAGAIYIIRDPRDVAVSYAEHMGQTIDQAIENMERPTTTLSNDDGLWHMIGDWSSHVRSWATETAFKTSVVRYEDLLVKPEEKFARIMEIFGGPTDEARLKKAVLDVAFANCKRQEKEKGFEEKKHSKLFFARGKNGNWQDVLSDKQVDRIERVHGEMMKRFGYL